MVQGLGARYKISRSFQIIRFAGGASVCVLCIRAPIAVHCTLCGRLIHTSVERCVCQSSDGGGCRKRRTMVVQEVWEAVEHLHRRVGNANNALIITVTST
jgi:hypothetical protein